MQPVNRSGLSRRSILKGAVVAATAPAWLGAVTAKAAAVAQVAPPAVGRQWMHAVGAPRGSRIAVLLGRAMEGRFGIMFKNVPAFAPPPELLTELAKAMVDDRNPSPSNDPSNHDAMDNFDIPAGFTFLGQFIDHDMTRDLTPLDQAVADPQATRNFNSSFLDLAVMYGGGPTANPELYDGSKMKIAYPHGRPGPPDLPRNAQGNAFVGDPRNDENIIVAQLHAAFLAFHNKQIDAGRTFAQAQQQTRWHYQYIVVNDFLTKIVGRDVVDSLLIRLPDGSVVVRNRFYRPGNPLKPMIPLEFAVAAYRFAHSMVRPQYEMNDADTGSMFSDTPATNLSGLRVFPANFAADWTYFYDIPGKSVPEGRNFARLIDTKLAIPMHNLPPEILASMPTMRDLAERNLMRGSQLGLPSGQDVARAMGLIPLSNAALGLTGAGWREGAPLWFYLLKESELAPSYGKRLGPVGGRIVAEVILGLLFFDRSSYMHARPVFAPKSGTTDLYCMGDFLRAAGVA